MVDRNQLRACFEERYGSRPRLFSSPGRVNIIGEHTDYNEGFVLPIAITRRTYAAVVARNDSRVRVESLVLHNAVEFDLNQPTEFSAQKWAKYVAGVVWTLRKRNVDLTGADMMIDSDVPIGAGLSSSAALEVATAKALIAISGATIAPLDLALSAQEAEHEFVGAKVGIMDHLAAVFGRSGHALLIDCRSLQMKQISLAKLNAAIVVCNTNVKHDLAASAYNQRRAECELGVELLRQRLPGISALRDISISDFDKYEGELTEPIRRRCRHVVTENERTLAAAEALADGDCARLGELMRQSHASLRDDYEVSSPELDLLVEIASPKDGVFGARMTGGGFGGCTINIVRDDYVEQFTETIKGEYQAATNIAADVYLVEADDGAGEEIN